MIDSKVGLWSTAPVPQALCDQKEMFPVILRRLDSIFNFLILFCPILSILENRTFCSLARAPWSNTPELLLICGSRVAAAQHTKKKKQRNRHTFYAAHAEFTLARTSSTQRLTVSQFFIIDTCNIVLIRHAWDVHTSENNKWTLLRLVHWMKLPNWYCDTIALQRFYSTYTAHIDAEIPFALRNAV